MQQISTAEFKNGMGLKIKDKIYTLVEFQHVKPGKGGAFVRYKIKDLRSGRVIGDQTCNAGSKFDSVMLSTKEMQYLYNDGDNYYFMDKETYEQIPVAADFIGENSKWLKENDTCQMHVRQRRPSTPSSRRCSSRSRSPRPSPGFKGDTVQGGAKPATVETGAEHPGARCTSTRANVIKVDTREGKYVAPRLAQTHGHAVWRGLTSLMERGRHEQ